MVHRTPFFLPLLYPTLTWRMPAEGNNIYLTFDDGPVPGPTDFVVDTLQRAGATATFFCIGDNVRKHADVFAHAAAAGHTMANHTFNHLNGWRHGTAHYVANTQQCSEQLRAASTNDTALTPLFRPPYGRITRKQIAALTGYRIIMWDVLTMDYNKRLNHERCLKNTIAATRPGSIVVFHDSYKAEKNLQYVLPRYIDDCLSKGYHLKPLV